MLIGLLHCDIYTSKWVLNYPIGQLSDCLLPLYPRQVPSQSSVPLVLRHCTTGNLSFTAVNLKPFETQLDSMTVNRSRPCIFTTLTLGLRQSPLYFYDIDSGFTAGLPVFLRHWLWIDGRPPVFLRHWLWIYGSPPCIFTTLTLDLRQPPPLYFYDIDSGFTAAPPCIFMTLTLGLRQVSLYVYDIDSRFTAGFPVCLRHWLSVYGRFPCMFTTLTLGLRQVSLYVYDIDSRFTAGFPVCLRHWLSVYGRFLRHSPSCQETSIWPFVGLFGGVSSRSSSFSSPSCTCSNIEENPPGSPTPQGGNTTGCLRIRAVSLGWWAWGGPWAWSKGGGCVCVVGWTAAIIPMVGWTAPTAAGTTPESATVTPGYRGGADPPAPATLGYRGGADPPAPANNTGWGILL